MVGGEVMSKSKPRHPLHWPRMKIRGRRRRALAAERVAIRAVYFMPVVAVGFSADSLQVTALAVAAGDRLPGHHSMRFETMRIVDGFGRPVVGVR